MRTKTRVILVTDGDHVAKKTLEMIAKQLHLRCISLSAGNPMRLDGPEVVQLLAQAKYDPVIVMCDDNGVPAEGAGEQAIRYIVNHPAIEVLGAVAVASNTEHVQGAHVDCSVTRDGVIINGGVNKDGSIDLEGTGVIKGDTVDILDSLDIPVIVGTGDIGKMDRRDDISRGAPVTVQAIQEILRRNGVQLERK